MKQNKLVLRFCALCMALSVSFGFASCDLSNILGGNTDSQNSSTPETSSVEESSSPEASEEEPDDGKEDPAPNPAMVTAEEWAAAFAIESFLNVTVTVNEQYVSEETEVVTGSMAVAYPNISITSTESGLSTSVYFEQDGNTLYQYYDYEGDGIYSKLDATLTMGDLVEVTPYATLAEVAPYYSLFTYNVDTDAYEAAGPIEVEFTYEDENGEEVPDSYTLTNVSVKFDNGKIVAFSSTTTGSDGNGGEVVTLTQYSLSNYGTTTVTLPTIPTGEISLEDWQKALSPDSFKNVTAKMSTLGITLTQRYDDSQPNVLYGYLFMPGTDEEGNPDNITSAQYHIKDGDTYYAYVNFNGSPFSRMDSTAEEWDAINYLNKFAQIYDYYNLYASMSWNGLTATLQSEDIYAEFIFNEQKQLISYKSIIQLEDGPVTTVILFSDYGTTTFTAPSVPSAPTNPTNPITLEDWQKALTPEAFKNVTITSIMPSDGFTSTKVQKYDDKQPNAYYVDSIVNGVAEDGVPYTSSTTQYYTKENDAYYSYTSTDNSEYSRIEINAETWAYDYMTQMASIFGEYDNYAIMQWDGLTATYTEAGSFTQFVFNEQKQLVSYTFSYSIMSITITFSDYGTTTFTVPNVA